MYTIKIIIIAWAFIRIIIFGKEGGGHLSEYLRTGGKTSKYSGFTPDDYHIQGAFFTRKVLISDLFLTKTYVVVLIRSALLRRF